MTDARPPQQSWAERFRGAMLGGAVGDALGAGVRDSKLSEIEQWFGPQGVVDYLPVFGRRGASTELTQLTVFTLESLLRAKASNPTSSGWLPTEFVLANYLRWLHTQGVPWDYAMSAYLATEPTPNSWLLERPELYSTRNPCGAGLHVIGSAAQRSPLGADGSLHAPLKADGLVDFAVWAAPTMAWSNVPEEVFAAGAAAANLLVSAPNSVGAAGLHSDVLAQLIRGVPLWDAVNASDQKRLGVAYWTGRGPADVRRTLHAAMFVGQRGCPTPRQLEIEFELGEKPGELGIALAAVGSTRTFADAVRVAVNHSGDSAVTGALAGQLAGAIYGPAGIPARWLDELELREILENLCADATEAFAPRPQPQWAQRYSPNARQLGGPPQLTGGSPNTVEGSAEQTMLMPVITSAGAVDTPPAGLPVQNPRADGIGAPTFPAARAGTTPVSDPSSTGPIPVPNLRSPEEPAETTAVFPAIVDDLEPPAAAPQIGAFPPPAAAQPAEAVPEPADLVDAEEPDVDREVAERIVRESADSERIPVPDAVTPDPEPVVDEDPAESTDPEDIAEPEDVDHAEPVDPGRIVVPEVVVRDEDAEADREVAERTARESADFGRISVPEVVSGQGDSEPDENTEADLVDDEPVDDAAEDVADSEVSEVPQPAVEREPVDMEPPVRTPIDLEPADAGADDEPADEMLADDDDPASAPDEAEPSDGEDEPAPVAPPIVRGGHAKADGPGDSAPSLTERVLGCFLGGALGDSLGSDLEFINAEAITARFGPEGPSGLREAYGVRGAITDDTQMTLFTAEGLIRGSVANRVLGSDDPLPEVQLAYQRWLHTQGVDWDAAAGAFLADYPAPDGWLIEVPGLFATRAPGKTVWRALARFGDGKPAGSFTERINDSKGCGGVMRAAPAALWSTDPAEVFRLAARTAAVTHSHPAGYHSAGALAVIVQQALLGRGLDDGVWLALQVLETWEDHEETSAALKAAVALAEAGEPTPEQVAEQLGGGWVGEEALAIAVCAALVAEDVEQALRIAVHHDGDSDSTGAICGNIVGALHGVAALPVDWLAELELRDVVEQIALDCVAEFGHGAFLPGQAAIEPPTGEDWNERYPVRPHWAAAPEPVAAAPGPEFPAPKPAPRRINGVMHDELSEGEDE
ncbi:ADP-ribosylglycohydrolase [Saccharopolyspora antimicrobica]|uniref:ADP-ribosylglycohydrolase n=1 Tax=Saccharopolyspora antimicrobica TaxID=455193 RepID=A0A1I5DN24_9PSEU|nr:ADP-ribosylglycohydrolase family protein [Saccharopolyspora antimicrobica]RKT85051.1 ADP-ribosylglycohydrolase [Saccharopolyspora antimicrobica]SFO00644.1 ADP-ribosylglycohydrolase [Saccharopolyspora antimicrobica]